MELLASLIHAALQGIETWQWSTLKAATRLNLKARLSFHAFFNVLYDVMNHAEILSFYLWSALYKRLTAIVSCSRNAKFNGVLLSHNSLRFDLCWSTLAAQPESAR